MKSGGFLKQHLKGKIVTRKSCTERPESIVLEY